MKHTLSLLFAALVCLFTACEHKPLIMGPVPSNPGVTVIFDWSEVNPDEIPETVDLFFYPEDGDGGAIDRTLPTDEDEQFVPLPYNVYRLLVTAGSEQYTTRHPGPWDALSLTIDEQPNGVIGHILGQSNTQYREPDNYQKPLAYALDPIYAYIIERVDVNGEESTTVVVKPRRVAARYNVYVHGLKVNPSYVQLFGGALSGLNGGLLPGKTLFSDKCVPAPDANIVTQPFAFDWKGEETATTKLYTFGVPDTDQRQLLYLYIWSDENGLLSLRYDVTNQIAKATDPMNVDIHVGNTDFDTDHGDGFGPDGSGYDPFVSPFEPTEDQEIQM